MSDKRLKRVHINNFKCHKNLELDLAPLTILAGGNASGKSSFIQSILMWRKSLDDIKSDVLSTDNIYGLNCGLPSSMISSGFTENKISISVESGFKKLSISLLPQDAGEESLSFTVEREWGAQHFEFPRLFYLNAERNGPRIFSKLHESLGFYVGGNGENTGYVIHKMDRVDKIRKEYEINEEMRKAKVKRFSANCEYWLQHIIPEIEFQHHVDYKLNLATIEYRNKGELYLPTATGFGISYVLPIIVQGLVSTTQAERDSVLIVENPEAHLHPYSQSNVGKFLALVASYGAQVIIETHSEHIINGCRLQLAYMQDTDKMKIVFFDQDAKTTYINVEGNGELEHWPEGFFDQTKKDLRELLELRRCGR